MSRLVACKRCKGAHVSAAGIEIACAESDHPVVRWGAGSAAISPMQARVLSALLTQPGRVLTTREICEHLWGDDPEGGPTWAMGNIRVHIHKLRQRLASAGFPGRVDVRFRFGISLVMP